MSATSAGSRSGCAAGTTSATSPAGSRARTTYNACASTALISRIWGCRISSRSTATILRRYRARPRRPARLTRKVPAPAGKRRRLEQFFGRGGYPRDLDATTAAFGTAAEAGLVASLTARAGGPALDLGCGFGRHLRELAARGAVAAGADIVFDCCARSASYAPVVCCD